MRRDRQDENIVANPGSTLGEAIGALIERQIHRILHPVAQRHACQYITTGPLNSKTGKPTKLLLTDNADNQYSIDAVIVNNHRQPLVIIESKYIRYTKHNRDKGSWACTAHYSLRRRYPSIRKSIAVLAGSWSHNSKALMRSFDIDLFEVPFSRMVTILEQYGIRYDWGEKERDLAMLAWQSFQKLSQMEIDAIGKAF